MHERLQHHHKTGNTALYGVCRVVFVLKMMMVVMMMMVMKVKLIWTKDDKDKNSNDGE